MCGDLLLSCNVFRKFRTIINFITAFGRIIYSNILSSKVNYSLPKNCFYTSKPFPKSLKNSV